MLNSASSDFLSEKVVFEDNIPGGVSSINQVNAGSEIILALHRGVAVLNSSFEVQSRIQFNGHFHTVNPIPTNDPHSYRFIAYKLFKKVVLLNSKGEEIWGITGDTERKRYIEGVQCGDINGDGKPEFAIYYRYGEGITLVDEEGKILWKHPVYALGHLEIKDVRESGKEEIVYSNSNNANLATVFTTLDADGTVVDQLDISTASYEFAIIKWPDIEGCSHILLTEENRIRIVDMKGSAIVQLDAPGCRSFGKVKAITVKFQKEKPAYLAVRKILHPDLDVLYIYDANDKLVFQKSEVIKGSMQPSLATVIVDKSSVERLLVGAKQDYYGTRVLEYSLAQ
jgi:hypothetical protein